MNTFRASDGRANHTIRAVHFQLILRPLFDTDIADVELIQLVEVDPVDGDTAILRGIRFGWIWRDGDAHGRGEGPC